MNILSHLEYCYEQLLLNSVLTIPRGDSMISAFRLRLAASGNGQCNIDRVKFKVT